MISRKTAQQIATCYFDIEQAEWLLTKINESQFKDEFGNVKELMLGTPTDGLKFNMYGIDQKLACLVIQQHIFAQRIKLEALNKEAEQELNIE